VLDRFSESAETPVYIWSPHQSPASIRLHLQMIGDVDRAVTAVVRSLTVSGSEIGGILLGSVSDGNPTIVTVSDYELVTCDYSRGPFYQLSAADLKRLDDAIARRAAVAGRLQAVGFFRSHTRKELALYPDDIAICKARFSQPHQFAMLVRPGVNHPSTAGIFIWEDGAMRADSTYLEFPFSRDELTKRSMVTKVPIVSESTPQVAMSTVAPVLAPEPQDHPQEPARRAQVVAIPARSQEPQPAVARPVATSPTPVVKREPLTPAVQTAPAVTPSQPAVREAAVVSKPQPQPQLSPAPAAAPAAATANSGGTGMRARVGRCSVKVQLRTAKPSADSGPNGHGSALVAS